MLELKLSRVQGYVSPSAELEQYQTPPHIAATILFDAFMSGDVQERSVADFGCGTGTFAIGAAMLGAASVVGIEIDSEALKIAQANASALLPPEELKRIQFIRSDIRAASGSFDTVIQNPPFGSQSRHADLPFLLRAMETGHHVYTIHQLSTRSFMEETVRKEGGEIIWEKRFRYRMPHTFSFHSRHFREFELILYKIRGIR